MPTRTRINPFGDSSKQFEFFPSVSHKKCVHRIVRGLESNCGLILLTGEIGVGKTSVSWFIQSYLSDAFVFAELGNPYQTALEQVYSCCEQFGLPRAGLSSINDCVRLLEQHFRELLKVGMRPVLVFDESHLLTKKHLSLVHILSNLRADDGPLVQILLVGQLEILELLGSEEMKALNQRIGVRCELSPLVLDDTGKYIKFKLEKGGLKGKVSFSGAAVERIWRASRGLPRLINHVCAHALDALAFKGETVVTPELVEEICRESVNSGLFLESGRPEARPRRLYWAAGGGFLVAAALAALVFWVPWSGGTAGEAEAPFVTAKVDGGPPLPVGIGPEAAGAEAENATPGAIGPEMAGPEAQNAIPGMIGPEMAGPGIAGPEAENATLEATGEGQTPQILLGAAPDGAGEPAGASNATGSGAGTVRDGSGAVRDGLGAALDEAAALDASGAVGAAVPDGSGLPDGAAHPVLQGFVIDAIAWTEDPAQRVAVVNSEVVHEGDTVDVAKVKTIGQDFVVFEINGTAYRLSIPR
ncbi:MAG: AAA family ATPase [Desulfovibrionaceae bacterium]